MCIAPTYSNILFQINFRIAKDRNKRILRKEIKWVWKDDDYWNRWVGRW